MSIEITGIHLKVYTTGQVVVEVSLPDDTDREVIYATLPPPVGVHVGPAAIANADIIERFEASQADAPSIGGDDE